MMTQLEMANQLLGEAQVKIRQLQREVRELRALFRVSEDQIPDFFGPPPKRGVRAQHRPQSEEG